VVSFKPQSLYHPVRTAGTLWIGGWVGPRVGLNALAKRKKNLIAPVGN